MSFFELTIIGITWISAFHFSAQDGNILGFIERGFKTLEGFFTGNVQKFARLLAKPLFSCPPCMASIHGILLFWVTGEIGMHDLSFAWVLLYVPVLSGANSILQNLMPYAPTPPPKQYKMIPTSWNKKGEVITWRPIPENTTNNKTYFSNLVSTTTTYC